MNSATTFAKSKFGIAVIIVAICIIMWVVSSWNLHGQEYENFVYGYWVADDNFCEESEIDSMLLFIGKPNSDSGGEIIRPAHMIITDDIMNQKISLKYKRIKSGMARKLNKFSVECQIEFEEECQIPSDVTMDFDIRKGSIRMEIYMR
jgi:hypothetical protein